MTISRPVRLLFIAPAVLYLIVLTQAPFVLTLWYSVHRWVLTSPELGVTFVGLSNFAYTILHDAIFRESVLNLVTITLGIIVCSLVLGLILALLLNRTFPLRSIARSLAIAPFFVMPTVNAVVWKNLLLNPVFGLLTWLGVTAHLPRIDVLSTYPKLGIIAMSTWQWTPFMMLIILAGLQSVPDDVLEAAHLDGAEGWSEFRYITLPLVQTYVELAVLLATVYVLQLFGEIYVATQGGPGSATTTIPYYVFQTISQSNDVGSASAQGVCAVVIASVIAALLIRLMLRSFRSGVAA